jgi:hypothetical protein
MNTNKRYFLLLMMVTIFTSLSSCSLRDTSQRIDSQASTPVATPTMITSPTPNKKITIAQLRAKSPQTDQLLSTAPTTNVTLYTSDTQCQELIPQVVSVSAAAPIKSTVGKILEKQDRSDFSLSGYRVNVKQGVATIDLRMSPESKRQLASLSSCEQFALFGSLRKTLTSNAKWNIKEVYFTERGEEITL